MAGWAQWLIGAAAVSTAVGILWTKVIKPIAHLITLIEDLAAEERRKRDLD